MELKKTEKVLELRAKGYSFAKIAKEASIAKQTAIDICHANAERLANLYALELEELMEKSKITHSERIKAHTRLLQRIDEEIEQRRLNDISTERLIDLRIKQATALKGEIIEPIFRSTEEQETAKRNRETTDSLTWEL